MKKTPVICLLIWSLVLQLAFAGSPSIPQAFAQSRSDSQKIDPVLMAVASSLVDPALSSIDNDPHVNLELALNPNDAVVDQDPFFLRAQSWTYGNASGDNADIEARTDAQGVSLTLPESNRTWRLNLPVHPILQTDEFIFFAVNAGSNLFGNAVDGDHGEGLFFVKTGELISASVHGELAPIRFFPMPGDGWQAENAADVGAHEIPARDAVVFTSTSGLPLPVALSDVRLMSRVEDTNLILASQGALAKCLDQLEKNSGRLADVRDRFTQAFGEITRQMSGGADVNTASADQAQVTFSALVSKLSAVIGVKNLVMPRGSTAAFGLFYTGFDLDEGAGSRVFQIARDYQPRSNLTKVVELLTGQPAYAIAPLLVTFGTRAAVILAKSAVIYGVGVALRYTLLKKAVQTRLNDGTLKGKRSVTWTVFAQSLTLLSQLPLVWPANMIEYVLDRAGVAENSRIRRMYDATFGYARRANTGTPTDARTFVSGTLIQGGGDTSQVAIQQYFAIPWIARLLPLILPVHFLVTRVAAAFGGPGAHVAAAAADLAAYNIIAVLYNFVAYWTSGASSNVSNIQDIETNKAIRTVADQMRSEGINPDEPKNKPILDQRVHDIVQAELARQGYPTEKTLLFGASTLYQSVQGWFGYKAPEGRNASDYYGILRPGLQARALAQAIAAARAQGNQGAVQLLRGAQRDLGLVRTFLSSPKSFLTPRGVIGVARDKKRVESELVSFTLKGQPEDPVKISKDWGGGGPAAQEAAQIYRKAFFKLLTSDDNEAGEAQAAKNKPVDYNPMTREGLFARWQLRRAVARSVSEFVKQTGQDPSSLYMSQNTDTAALRARYEAILKAELLKTVGLYPDPQEAQLIANVDSRTEVEFQRRLGSIPGLAEYINTLSPFEKAKVEQIYKSDIFAETYVNATIREERVGALSPAQPGAFQKIRQTKFFRNSPAATRTIRFFEGMFSDSRYNRGFMNLLMRQAVPMLDDQISGNKRSLRYLPVAGTFNYFYSRGLWNNILPYEDWLTNYTFRGSTIIGPSATAQRIADKEGWKVGSSYKSMAKFTVIYSWATFSGGLWYALFHTDIQNGLNLVGTACKVLLKTLGL